MSELTLFLIRVAFLAILWIFVLSAISVIRSDMFGARVPEAVRGSAPVPAGRKGRSKPAKARRGAPNHLIVVEGDNPGTRAELADAPLLIGRGSDAAIKLDDDYVSTRHARITSSTTGYQVEDLGSTNGTFINNQRIAQPTPFGIGDTLRIGRTLMSVEK